jgi:hypothetical protein
MATSQQARIVKEIEAVRHQVGDALSGILQDVNRERLKNKGKLTAAPKAERNSLRWTLEWKDGDVNYDLNVVVVVEDDGTQARVGRVWVQRHASTPLEFDGHTPTTRIRRLTMLSLPEIREAIEAEWG